MPVTARDGVDRAAAGADLVGDGEGDAAEVDDAGRRAPAGALMPAACGSSSRIRSGPTTSSPGTPFASARSRRPSNRSSSDASSATTSLPQRSNGMSCSVRERLDGGLALAAEAGLERARRVVQAGVEDAAELWPDWCVASSASFSRISEPHVGMPLEQAIGGREADDPAADDREVDPVLAHDARTDRRRSWLDGPDLPGTAVPPPRPTQASAAWWRPSMTTPRRSASRSARPRARPGSGRGPAHRAR